MFTFSNTKGGLSIMDLNNLLNQVEEITSGVEQLVNAVADNNNNNN